jgi:hypothetical protein
MLIVSRYRLKIAGHVAGEPCEVDDGLGARLVRANLAQVAKESRKRGRPKADK